MNKSIIAILGLAACLSVPAMAQSIPEKSGINSLMGVASRTADFVKIATISDMFEIQSSELAQQNHDPTLTAFAARMIEDHKKISHRSRTPSAAATCRRTSPLIWIQAIRTCWTNSKRCMAMTLPCNTARTRFPDMKTPCRSTAVTPKVGITRH